MRKLLSVLIFGLATSPAWAVTIDFSEFPGDPNTEIPVGVALETQGYTIDRNDNTILIISDAALPPDAPALAWSPSTTLSLEESSGGIFTLTSFDLFNVSAPVNMTITGFVASGGTVQQDIATENMWRTYSFGTEWSRLTRVELEGTASGLGQIIDNIKVNVVPVPSALLLFPSALALLGLRRRVQNRR